MKRLSKDDEDAHWLAVVHSNDYSFRPYFFFPTNNESLLILFDSKVQAPYRLVAVKHQVVVFRPSKHMKKRGDAPAVFAGAEPVPWQNRPR